MNVNYTELLVAAGLLVIGAAAKAMFDWLNGRTPARIDETESVIKQLTILIKELRTARDRDREDAAKNRACIVKLQGAINVLEQKVEVLEERITALLKEAQNNLELIAEQRERLRGAGVEPPAEPGKLEKSDG